VLAPVTMPASAGQKTATEPQSMGVVEDSGQKKPAVHVMHDEEAVAG
jgi:hypothetical protein